MTTDEQASSTDSTTSDAEFQALLAEYLARVERDGTAALEEFRARHPAFASRLGRQFDRLVEHMAKAKDGLPETIGPYRILRRLGVGGMGEVYLGEQTKPFRRLVAVKVIKFGKDTESSVQRFAREIQTLALLNHNGIAKVFEAASHGGRPYFAMEYVPGKPITEYSVDEGLDVGERLRLFIDVCRAVEYAHRQGIIHRDIKPSNVLIYGPRTEPVAKIIDFGLAKAIHGERAGELPVTKADQIVGTPDYMSPEQVDDSDRSVVDTRADVYALGVVLYELLTGVLPLDVGQLAIVNVEAAIRAIREREPSSPSMRVEESASESDESPSDRGVVALRRLSRRLAGDLDSIVMKALAKNANRRYGGAAQLADDILRHLRDEPVIARPPTRRYLLHKFLRRHRLAVGSAAAIVVLVMASLVTINVYAVANSRNLERGNLFGLIHYLDQLRERDSIYPPPARPDQLDALREWLREFEALVAQRDRMRVYLASPEAQADAANPSDWASGRNAQRTLRGALEDAANLLERMAAPGAEVDNMRLRIEWAQRVVALTIDAHKDQWERVRREVRADPRFEDLDIAPQVGLIPLGRHEATGLQEFAFPLPGSELPRRVDGRLRIGARTCPVFVLLPGGDVLIGSQSAHVDQVRHDPAREALEADLRRVRLEPFFASQHELTNGQWRLVDSGRHGEGLIDALHAPEHPLTDVNDAWMMHVVHAWGMRLPTSHEWEYLARGDTDTPYWCGPTFMSLEKRENLFDESRRGRPEKQSEGENVPWSDGFPDTAPVGSLEANRFLMYDVLGNACEVAIQDATGEEPYLELRGSSYHEGARDARATARLRWDGAPRPSIGFRPVVSVQQR